MSIARGSTRDALGWLEILRRDYPNPVGRAERQYWTSNVPVVLLIRAPTSAERNAVLNAIYEMREPQFKQYWIAKIFRAEMSSPPKVVYSNESANQLVSSIPGAIAFMSSGDVRAGIKVLRIDGHLPGESGYRLHLTGK